MDLKSFLSTVNADSPVGLSAPLPVIDDDCAIIDYYYPELGPGHLQVPLKELRSTAEQLSTGQHFPVAVHGLKRIRKFFGLRDLELVHNRVWDTRFMADLLDLGRADDHGYRLSALVREYLNQDYPYMGESPFVSVQRAGSPTREEKKNNHKDTKKKRQKDSSRYSLILDFFVSLSLRGSF